MIFGRKIHLIEHLTRFIGTLQSTKTFSDKMSVILTSNLLLNGFSTFMIIHCFRPRLRSDKVRF